MLDILTILIVCQNSIDSNFINDLHVAATTYDIAPELLLSVVAVESNCDNKRVSETNNIGYGQIGYHWYPKARSLGYDVHLPKDNLLMTAYILSNLSSFGDFERLRRYHGYKTNTTKANRYAERVLEKEKLTQDKRL